METPSVRWVEGQIHIFTYDGTCTFTHVAAYTSDGRIYAALDPPLVRFESGNFDIPPQTLRWYDEKEQSVKPPVPGDVIDVIYFHGQRIGNRPVE